jgi:hypothetical protein
VASNAESMVVVPLAAPLVVPIAPLAASLAAPIAPLAAPIAPLAAPLAVPIAPPVPHNVGAVPKPKDPRMRHRIQTET